MGVVALVAAALLALGWVVSAAFANDSFAAAAAAVGATALASVAAGIPLAYAGGPPASRLNRALAAMLLRLVLVGVLATAAALVLEPPRQPFLIWLVGSYLALLAVDTVFSVRPPPDAR